MFQAQKMFACVLIAVLVLLAPVVLAAADLPAAPVLASMDAKDEPGLELSFASLEQNAAQVPFHDTRIARLASLYVPQASAPSIFTEAGKFRATFEGDLNLRLRDFLFSRPRVAGNSR